MTNNSAVSLPDIGLVKPPTPEQCADARAYIRRHGFDDETELLAMLNLEGNPA